MNGERKIVQEFYSIRSFVITLRVIKVKISIKHEQTLHTQNFTQFKVSEIPEAHFILHNPVKLFFDFF